MANANIAIIGLILTSIVIIFEEIFFAMKKMLTAMISLCVLTGCYDSYLREYDYTAGYITYQYDLRTFVHGEDECFRLPVALAGVTVNDQDRQYKVTVDPSLCTSDLSGFCTTAHAPFSAIDGMMGKAPIGDLAGGSGSYVTADLGAAGIDALEPLPEDYYSLDFSGLAVRKGDVTASAVIKANEKFFADPKAYSLGYAIAYKINSAEVDSLYPEKSFAVVAVRAENRFYGSWYHGGKSVVDGQEVKYPFSIPQEDGKVYSLETVSADVVRTDRHVQEAGSLILTFNGDDITVSSDEVTIVEDSRRSCFNGAKTLQDRVLYLNYSYVDAKGRTVQVSDSLMFRNRIRDGINEWQDTDPTHYK